MSLRRNYTNEQSYLYILRLKNINKYGLMFYWRPPQNIVLQVSKIVCRLKNSLMHCPTLILNALQTNAITFLYCKRSTPAIISINQYTNWRADRTV